jgi:hypothetical protein
MSNNPSKGDWFELKKLSKYSTEFSNPLIQRNNVDIAYYISLKRFKSTIANY